MSGGEHLDMSGNKLCIYIYEFAINDLFVLSVRNPGDKLHFI